MPNENNESPSVLIRHLPTRHGGVSNAVPNEIKQFAIRRVLDLGTAKIEWRRIQATARLSRPTPVIIMTALAFLFIQVQPGRNVLAAGISHERVLQHFRGLRNAHAYHPPCNARFESQRFLPSY